MSEHGGGVSNTQSIADYLAQLLKDRKQVTAFPNVFIHVERLIDEVGPNDCVAMTTWLENYSYSTFKSTTVGKPVVSDTVRIPGELLSSAACCQPPNPVPPETCLEARPSVEAPSCPIPLNCPNPECRPQPQPDSDSKTTSEAISKNEDQSDENQTCTSSEDETISDSEGEIDCA